MKCDELKQEENPIEWGLYYDKNEVDAAIAELKAENERLKKKMDDYHLMSDIRRSKIKELKRALYKSCANWAKSERYTEATWHGDEHREELWANVQAKCLKKAEEYK